jgi:hypothetical protein
MKRIINGRLFDDQFMNEIGSRSFDKLDPVTGEHKTYREALLREYVLKPRHTLADTWVQGQYGRRIVRENCDLTQGQFVLKVTQGWGEGIFVPIDVAAARKWFEDHMPDSTDLYTETFGRPFNPWTNDGTVDIVTKAESRVSTLEYEKERMEKRATEAEAEIAELKAKLKAKLEAISKLTDGNPPDGDGGQL